MDKFTLSDLFISQAPLINGEVLLGGAAADFVKGKNIPWSEIRRMYKPALIFISNVTGKKFLLIIHRAGTVSE